MRLPVVLLADLLCVVVFVVVGQRSHAESLTLPGVLGTLWPFLVALLLGWAAARVWRPRRGSGLLGSGVLVWLVTWLGGLGLRITLAGETAQPAFVVVSGISLGLTMLGWRLVASLLGRRRRVRLA